MNRFSRAFFYVQFEQPEAFVPKYGLKVLRRLFSWYLKVYAAVYGLLARLHIVERVRVFTTPHGYRIALPVTEGAHFAMRRYGIWEPGVRKWIDRVTSEGMRVCEIGANLGETTLELAHQVGPAGKVYSFEVDRKYIEIVQRSLRSNGFTNVELAHRAVAPRPIRHGKGYGDKWARIENFPELNYYISLPLHEVFSHAPVSGNNGAGQDDEVVSCVDLFEHFKDHPPIDLFFMDIEGCELFAIPSILRLGQHWNRLPAICFEAHREFMSGPQIASLRQMLLNSAYEVSTIDYRHVVCTPNRLN